MNLEKLHQSIDAIDKIGDLNWRNNLNDRKLKELEFHDLDRDIELKKEISQDVENYNELFGNRKSYSTVRTSRSFVQV